MEDSGDLRGKTLGKGYHRMRRQHEVMSGGGKDGLCPSNIRRIIRFIERGGETGDNNRARWQKAVRSCQEDWTLLCRQQRESRDWGWLWEEDTSWV